MCRGTKSAELKPSIAISATSGAASNRACSIFCLSVDADPFAVTVLTFTRICASVTLITVISPPPILRNWG